MIAGSIDYFLAARVRLTVRGPVGEQEVEAQLDTGYNGFLSVPEPILQALGLAPVTTSQMKLGDGTVVKLPLYHSTVLWNGSERKVETDAPDGLCLLGMSLLEGHDVRLRVITNGRVEIEPIP